MRKAAARATSYINMSKDAEGNINYKWKLAVKSGQVSFKMGEEYEEVTPDGRTVKVPEKYKKPVMSFNNFFAVFYLQSY